MIHSVDYWLSQIQGASSIGASRESKYRNFRLKRKKLHLFVIKASY